MQPVTISRNIFDSSGQGLRSLCAFMILLAFRMKAHRLSRIKLTKKFGSALHVSGTAGALRADIAGGFMLATLRGLEASNFAGLHLRNWVLGLDVAMGLQASQTAGR